eukprot:6729941-Alexandrium_andersonii.AAC.1
MQGVPLVRSAGERGRALSVHSQARQRALEGEQAARIDAALAEVPTMQADASGQDAAQLLIVYVQRR